MNKVMNQVDPLPLTSVAGKANPIGRLQEPIQVRHVQLDIEDDSSDYSSDMGNFIDKKDLVYSGYFSYPREREE